ncbi:MAG: spore protease YyaC [Sulfobacillus benefaciens]|uniref:Spore protease YyaC n=1 Tax=Sulfobacillus benefaciens TaxID=453960 RepID=A0A2T2XHL4_9FIRM|nr:MAG: spore protease YyaC [Sulfobacillus benefaciens]
MVNEAARTLRWLWRRHGPPEAVLCIGTDRSTGDALGPLVGSEMETRFPRLRVLGTLAHPVHAANLNDVLKSHRDIGEKRLLAVDASLGRLEDVGTILIGLGPLRPGSGVNKQLPALGLYHITGTVNVGGFMEYFVLQNTRLALVIQMASFIALALIASLSP